MCKVCWGLAGHTCRVTEVCWGLAGHTCWVTCDEYASINSSEKNADRSLDWLEKHIFCTVRHISWFWPLVTIFHPGLVHTRHWSLFKGVTGNLPYRSQTFQRSEALINILLKWQGKFIFLVVFTLKMGTVYYSETLVIIWLYFVTNRNNLWKSLSGRRTAVCNYVNVRKLLRKGTFISRQIHLLVGARSLRETALDLIIQVV